MGYGANPNDSDFTIVTVVLQYGVFASVSNGTQCVGRNAPGLTDRGPAAPCLIMVIGLGFLVRSQLISAFDSQKLFIDPTRFPLVWQAQIPQGHPIC